MDDVYEHLVDAINEVSSVIKFSKIDELYTLLAVMFSQEQAEVGAKMRPGPHTAEQIAEVTGKSVEDAARILESMADDGTIYSSASKENRQYSLLPLLPGSTQPITA